MSLEEKLLRIRTPNLESQKHTAVILSSIEDTLREQKTKVTPTAYFAALLALLKQSATNDVTSLESDIVASTVYLLDLITSHVPATLLRTQFSSIATLLGPCLSGDIQNAQLIKAAIGCLESILIAQDASTWALPSSQISPRQAVTALLALAIDSRPKIRKRAQDAIKIILQSPPPGPSIDHPAAELCAVAAQNNLKNAVQIVQQNRKPKSRTDESHDPAIIHALQLTKTVAVASGGWPSKKIETLCEMLLAISRSRNDYLVMSAFEVFEVIFEGMQDELSSAKLPRLLEAIIELKPPSHDSQLLPPWVAILSRGYGTYAKVDCDEVFSNLPGLLDLIVEYLPSPSHNIRVSASECLVSFFANCIPNSAILDPSIYDEKTLQQIADKMLSLLAVKYQTAWMEVFNTLAALFDALRWRGDPYLLPIVRAIGELRTNDGFQGKKEADAVLGSAIRNIGPGPVLGVLPLHLVNPKPQDPGRAWLLPLIRDHVSNTSLAHFKSDMIPLSENMYERVMNHGSAEKTMDIKIYETVVNQVWSTLPGYCDLPIDLRSTVDQAFAEMLSNILYQQSELRVDICRALQNLVESNQAILEAEVDEETLRVERRTTKAQAEADIAHLATLSSNLLAVLFNVYSQTLPHSRAYILQCINAYLSITPDKDLVETFERVSSLLEKELPAIDAPIPKKEPGQQSRNKMPATSHTLLDLMIAMSIHLPRSTFAVLFKLASKILTHPGLLKSEPQLIKKAYKLIPRLASSPTGMGALRDRSADLQALLISTSESAPVPARRDRILALQTLISTIPLTDLHFIPTVLPEIVVACKDTNEKARTAGFDTLILAANTIANAPPHTTIRNSLVPHMPDSASDAPANLEEVFTMVSAGLAGVAPHMVAASVTALGRLLFEYHAHEALGQKTKEELVDTVSMFLQSNNREIVRSVLGFVKVVIVVLPLDLLEPRMPEVVPSLLVWSKENKGRLRAKVKNILDRLIRRFGGAQVEQWAGPEAKKLVTNIRKSRERAKRKKQGSGEVNSDDDGAEQRRYDNEFDEAVYGSEDDDSEIEGGDGSEDGDDAMSGVSFKTGARTTTTAKARRKEREQFIRQDDEDDEPLDLLDPKSISAISSSRKPLRRTGNEILNGRKTKAKVNEDGKLILGGDEDSDGDDTMLNTAANGAGDKSINAYIDAVSGPDAVRRGQKGRLKVKSGAQRDSRKDAQQEKPRNDEMDLDVEEAREVARKIMNGASSPKSNQRRSLGGEKIKSGSASPGSGVQKRRNNPKPGKKGVRFSSHPGRKARR